MLKEVETTLLTGKNTDSGYFYGYTIVIACLMISTIMWGSRLSFGVFIGPLLDEFGWSRGLTSAAFSITWIGAGFLSVITGRLNDRYGPRLIMTISGCLLGLGYYLISTVSNITQLFIYYSVINIGMSAVFTPIMSTVARWFTKRRALMSGIVLAGTGIALMTIVPLSNRFIIVYGWRNSYLMVALASFILITASAQLLRRDPFKMGKLPYGYDPLQASGHGAAVSGLTFKEALRTHQLYLLGASFGCAYMLYYIIISHVVLHATGEGIPLEKAVAIVSALGLAGVPGRILMGAFADRFGHKQAMLTSAVLILLSFSWLLFANQLWMLIVFAVALGFGHGGMATMESPMTAHIFGMRAHGAILGMVFAGDTIGGAIGPVIAGYVFDLTQSYGLAFKIALGITVINLAIVLFIKPVQRKGSPATV